MSTIKIEDVAYVRFSAPDLPRMHTFLRDFGMTDAKDIGDGVLRMRGTGTAPFIHVTEPGAPAFLALGLRAASVADLQRLAKQDDARVEPLRAPGGGSIVRLRDPNGFNIEVVAGQEPVARLPNGARDPWNTTAGHLRANRPKRVAPGPSKVLRFGHLVLITNDVAQSWNWYRDRFGFLISDEVRAPDGGLAALFTRCNLGSTGADHHSVCLAAVPGKPAQFHHAAFEVGDLDDLLVGHEHLKSKGYEHNWGVGRHILGSQVFDYWLDPWGRRVEHWTDGDLYAAGVAPNVTDLPTMLGGQWGPPSPPGFV